MKGIILFTVLIIGAINYSIHAQNSCPEFEWAKKAGGSSNDKGQSITIDDNGNSYVTGSFQGTATFGSTTFTSNIMYGDIFIAKLDNQGEFLWVKRGVAQYWSGSSGISVDNQGNCYITGFFVNKVTFGNIILTSSGGGNGMFSDIFIAKLDTNGDFLWAKNAGGNTPVSFQGDAPNNGYDISIDNQGNSYVTGCFTETIAFGSTTLSSNGDKDIFITKLDNQGNFLWAKNAGGNTQPSSEYDIPESGFGISVNNQGDSYVTGWFMGIATFGNTTLTSNGDKDIFITKLDNQGNFLWAKQAGGSFNDGYLSVAIDIDNNGNSYVTGSFSGTSTFGNTTLISGGISDVFIAKLDNQGNFLWAKQAGGSDEVGGNSIAVDNNGNSYITGYFYGAITFGNITINSSGISDIFIAKFDNQGNFLWVKKAGGSSLDYGYGSSIATDNNENSYVTGVFSGTASFGSTTLTSSGSNDICIIKIQEVEISYSITAGAVETMIDCGSSTQLNVSISGDAQDVSYSWSPTQGLSDSNIANPTASPGLTTTYTVTATTPNGCSATDAVTINVNNPNPPTVTIESSTGEFKLCDNGLTLSASGFVSYEWSDENGIIGTSPTLHITSPGTYTLVAYEASGCAGTASVTVVPLGEEIATPDGTVLCPNQPNQSIRLQAPSGMDSYMWSTGAETSMINVSQAGTYSVTITKGNCSYTMTVQVTVSNGQASADFSHSSNGLTVQFNAISPSINFLSWDFGDNSETSFDENPTHTYAQAGTYDVTVTITDFCGNTADKTKSITVSGTSSIEENPTTLLKLYPNPTNSKITIESETQIKEVVLRDMNGRLIETQTVNGQKTVLEMGSLSKGIYLIEVWDGESRIVKKVVKE